MSRPDVGAAVAQGRSSVWRTGGGCGWSAGPHCVQTVVVATVVVVHGVLALGDHPHDCLLLSLRLLWQRCLGALLESTDVRRLLLGEGHVCFSLPPSFFTPHLNG